MLARIEFSSSYGKENALTKVKLEELIEFLGEKVHVSQMKIDENGDIASRRYGETFIEAEVEKGETLVTPADAYEISDGTAFLVDLELFTEKFPNLRVVIRGIPKSVSNGNAGMLNEMKAIGDKIESAMSTFDKQIQFNERCDIHVPNLGLLNINKLTYTENACTDELQRMLDKGWRIIAACPQPDQRRPDYILGMGVSSVADGVSVEHIR